MGSCYQRQSRVASSRSAEELGIVAAVAVALRHLPVGSATRAAVQAEDSCTRPRSMTCRVEMASAAVVVHIAGRTDYAAVAAALGAGLAGTVAADFALVGIAAVA